MAIKKVGWGFNSHRS